MKRGKNYIGVSVGAMIFNDRGELFLARRSAHTSNEHGHWETPGGSVEFGETLAEAVRREMREEFGIALELVEQLPAHDHLLPAEGQHWVATTFIARLAAHQEPRILEPHKCEAIGWFPLDNLPEPLSRVTQADLREYRARREGSHP